MKAAETITASEFQRLYASKGSNSTPFKPKKKKQSNQGITQMKLLLTIEKIEFVTEYRFHPSRRWRFDIAIITNGMKIALEYEGGIHTPWQKSGHTTAKGYQKDTEKYNEATKLGWTVLRYTSKGYSKLIEDVKHLLNQNNKQ